MSGVPDEDEWETATITIDWEAPTAVELVPTAIHLMQKLDQSVIGHSQVKEALVAALRMHITRSEGRPPRLLLMGPHGVGKTTLAEALLDATDLPSMLIDFGDVANSGEADIPRMLSVLAPHSGSYMPYGVLFLDALEHLARPPYSSPRSFDERAVQVDLLRAINGRYEQLLICGAVTIEEPLKHTASQQELRSILQATTPLLPELSSRFDVLIPVDRLSAAQIAKSFALACSPFSRARRVISSLGGSFHCDPSSIEALARTCAVSPVGGWAANRVIDKLLEQVLRSPDPAKPWRLRDPHT